MTKRVLLLAPLLLAVGCTVGKDYKRPDIHVEGTYGAAAATQPTTQPTRDWWTTLNDPILNDLIARAAKANLDLRLAAARIKEARAYGQVTEANALPQLGIGAGYSRSRFSKTAAPYNAFDVPGFPWASDNYNLGFDASWEMDIFGGNRRATEAARADVDASVENQRFVLLSVYAEVARNYVELRGYQRTLEIAEDNLKLQQETLNLTIDRREKGVVTELDVARARAQVATTRAAIPQLQTLQWQAIHRIAVLLDEDIEPLGVRLTQHKPIPVPPDQIPLGVPAELLRRRPDIRRAERQVAAASARVGVATADLYPRFVLSGSFGLMSSQPKDLFRRDSRNYSFGPSVSWPIYDGGRLRGLLKASEAIQEQTILSYEQTIRRSIAEVRDALVAFTQEHDRRKSLAEAVQANQDAVDMARQLYDKGLADFLTVLDAQRALYVTQDALVRSELNESTSLIAVYKALGGGWEDQLPEKPTTQPVASKK